MVVEGYFYLVFREGDALGGRRCPLSVPVIVEPILQPVDVAQLQIVCKDEPDKLGLFGARHDGTVYGVIYPEPGRRSTAPALRAISSTRFLSERPSCRSIQSMLQLQCSRASRISGGNSSARLRKASSLPSPGLWVNWRPSRAASSLLATPPSRKSPAGSRRSPPRPILLQRWAKCNLTFRRAL